MRHSIGILSLLTFMQGAAIAAVAPPAVVLQPAMASIDANTLKKYTATVSNVTVKYELRWFVDGVRGGNGTTGLIDAGGTYDAPSIQPPNNGKLTIGVEVWSLALSGSPAAKLTSATAQLEVRNIAKLAITPASQYVPLGTAFDFNYTATNVPNGLPMRWLVNGVLGGNTTVGTVNTLGLYKAPNVAPAAGKVELKAELLAPGTPVRVLASAVAPIDFKNTAKVELAPSWLTIGLGQEKKLEAAVTGVAAGHRLRWLVNGIEGGNASVGSITTAGVYKAPLSIPASKPIVKVEVLPAAGSVVVLASDTSTVEIKNASSVVLTPSSLTLSLGAQQQFEAAVSGAPAGYRLRWLVNGIAGGNAAVGGINQSGVYKAPNLLPSSKPVVKVEVLPPGTSTVALASDSTTVYVKNTTEVILSPSSATVAPNGQLQFTTEITGAPSGHRTRWLVSEVVGGNATVGTITAAGLYKAPAVAPSSKPVVKFEVLPAGTSLTALDSDTTYVSVKYPPMTITSLSPAVIKTGPFNLVLRGTGFRSTTTATLNGVAATVAFISDTEIRIPGTATEDDLGSIVVVKASNPSPDSSSGQAYLRVRSTETPLISNLEAHRFLRQATWGPTPKDLDKLMRVGKQAWLQEQYALPASAIPDELLSKPLEYTQEHFLKLALSNNDQLRLRMAWALHKIWVVSGVEVANAKQYIPYLRVLLQHSFGNFYDVMRDVTLTAAMGEYLDMVNNKKGDVNSGAMPNENYAREIKQLFTLGLYSLNPDGTQQLDQSGQPVPTYGQDEVLAFARVFTGWTYSDGKPGAPTEFLYKDYGGPMEAVQKHHDTESKTLLTGTVLAANQSAETDLDQALRNIFQHPNVGPFIGRQLIQQLVTSNPSPAYVQRVAAVFANNGLGVRGDMKAVLTAILLDPEASLAAPNAGKMMEPALLVAGITRGIRATVTDTPYLADFTTEMGQKIFFPPSVFSYFSPGFRIAGGALAAPEFQIYTTATAMARVNFIAQLLSGQFGSAVKINWSALTPLGRDPELLMDYVNEVFMGSRMTPEMRTLILQAVLASPNDKEKVQTALYLTLLSPQFQVQR